jgi:hypothetical protein
MLLVFRSPHPSRASQFWITTSRKKEGGDCLSVPSKGDAEGWRDAIPILVPF